VADFGKLINIGRLLPQMFYHVAAYRQLPVASVPLIVSVPSGNFGNLTAGIFAKRIGLPVAKTWPPQTPMMSCRNICERANFIRGRRKQPFECHGRGQPKQFSALARLVPQPLEYVQRKSGVTELRTKKRSPRMKMLHDKFGYIADPHTAVGMLGWEAYKANILT